MVLYPNEAEYGETVMNNYLGFKALVHSPFDFPEVGGKGLAVESEKEVPFLEYPVPFIIKNGGFLKPKQIKTSQDLIRLSVDGVFHFCTFSVQFHKCYYRFVV